MTQQLIGDATTLERLAQLGAGPMIDREVFARAAAACRALAKIEADKRHWREAPGGPSRSFRLPYPPTVNHYWRHTSRGTFIDDEGAAYRQTVWLNLLASGKPQPLIGPLGVSLTFHPPDQRVRDLDNVLKAPLDALAAGGVYGDDHQIKRITATMGPPTGQPDCQVRIFSLSGRIAAEGGGEPAQGGE